MATADAASKPKLGISGYYELFMGVGDGDRTGTTSSGTPTYGGIAEGTFNMIHYGEIRFKASGKTDSGMKWGVYFEDVAGNDASTDGKKVGSDEANIWLSGSWGKLELGGQDGANDKVYAGAEKLMHHSPAMIDAFANTSALADEKMSSQDKSDDSKITYYTPKISGFQAGYSYIPNTNRESAPSALVECSGSNGCGPDSTQAHEGSISYAGKVGGGKVKASFGASYDVVSNTGTDGDSSFDHEFSWRAGATYSQGPWSVAAGYRKHNNDGDNISNDGDTKAWEVGASYSGGRYEVSVSYYDASHEDSAGDIDFSRWGVSGAYNLGGGLTAAASLWFYELDGGTLANDATIGDTDGTVGVISLGAKF